MEKGQVYKLEGSKWIKENTRVLATYNHSHVKKVSFINPTTEKNRFEYKNNKLNQFIGLKHYYPYKKFYPISQKNHRCLFINLDFITYKDMDNVVEIIRRGFADGVIVNFKDDTGNLIYGSKIKQAIEAKASFRHHKFNIFFSKLRKVNAYVVARLVAFKDYRMYTYKKNKYSLKNKQNGEPWKINKIEYWVDPFSTDIQNYLVSIFQELQDRREEFGLDEIQFDYIRFPSDSQLKTEVRFDFKKKDWERYDVLESLLSKISKKAEIPFSLDIFGYNGIYKMGNIIGQDIETISKYAPIICPMYYTSHFGSIYLQTDKSNDRVYNILKMGTERAIYYAYPGTKIAPFLQAFNYGIKIYDSEYIYQQIKGVKDGGSKSYNFWSPTSKYEKLLSFMVEIGNK